MKQENNLFCVPCPPRSKFSVPPPDMSKCKLVSCPGCDNPMWLSEKKEKLIAGVTTGEVLCRCYDCILELAKTNPGFFQDHQRVDL